MKTLPIEVDSETYERVRARSQQLGITLEEYLYWLFQQANQNESLIAFEPELKTGYIYILKDWNLPNTYKIGITTRSIHQRIKELNQCPGAAVKLEYLSPLVSNYKIIEKKLHLFFKNSNTYSGENLSLREWFVLTENQYTVLKQILIYEFGTITQS